MKSLIGLLLVSLFLVFPGFAQHTGSHSGSGGGEHHSGGSGFHGGHAGSGSISGHAGYSDRGRRSPGPTIVVPYAVPLFGYGYSGDPGYTAPAPAPAASPDDVASYVDVPQPAPPPAPEDTQPLAQPDDTSLQVYEGPVHTQTPEEVAMSEGHYYLIAYKDHSVYTALAYWMENGVLNYVTPQSAHNQVSLDLLDLDLTKQLNARRGYPFNLVSR